MPVSRARDDATLVSRPPNAPPGSGALAATPVPPAPGSGALAATPASPATRAPRPSDGHSGGRDDRRRTLDGLFKATAVALALALCASAVGCGKALHRGAGTSGGGLAGAGASTGAGGSAASATKNTTRLGGADAFADAAAVATAVYPGLTPATRPEAVVLVDRRDWPAALVASTLAGRPLHAPLLYTESSSLPEASTGALAAMAPTGASAVEGAQTISVGDAPAPSAYRSRAIRAGDSASLAVAVEQLASALRKRSPDRVIVTALDAPPAMTMPAAALAAQSGAPILLVQRRRLPQATATELARLARPTIYVVGPGSVVGGQVLNELRHYGPVRRIGGEDPAANAIAVARFSDGTFGWGVVEPGHGLAFANAQRPLDGPAAAPLAATGDYAPLLLVESADELPGSLTSYLSDLQPGTPPTGAVHGVYNHGWLIGDESAISARTQASIDAILQISPREGSEPEAG